MVQQMIKGSGQNEEHEPFLLTPLQGDAVDQDEAAGVSDYTEKGSRDARRSQAEGGTENVGGNFTESAAGSARTAPVDDTVNGALASRGRVAVRASVLGERSEASGLEISSDEPSGSAGASLVAPSLSFVASADTDDVNHDGDGVSARGSANNRVSDQQAPVMATSEVELEVGSRVATLSSVGSWRSHVTASSEGVVQVAARGVADVFLDHTAQEEPLPKCSTSFSSETLRKQGPPDAELAGSLWDTGNP